MCSLKLLLKMSIKYKPVIALFQGLLEGTNIIEHKQYHKQRGEKVFFCESKS